MSGSGKVGILIIQMTFPRFLFVFLTLALSSWKSFGADERPNIVLILTDNHGAWTLGCYGNEDIRTPHLDQMAKDGTLFSQAYAVNPVCSPTRASILTGLMPSQHGVMTPTDGPFMMGPKAYNLLGEFESIPEILKANGYSCGLSGKWHLGKNLEPQEGLDDMWVTMPVGSTSTFYGAKIIENGEVRVEPQYMTDLWTDRAVGFIEEQTSKPGEREPYFLYLAYNGPYGLSPLLLEPIRNRHADFYGDHLLPSFPRVVTRPWQFPNRGYVNNLDAFRRYAAEVSGVDDGVGRVLEAIRESGTEKETLVIFTGDQGLGCGQNNLWGMGDHTRPLHLFDVTLRVPMIIRLPGKVKANQRVDELVSQVDLFPTIMNIAGLESDIPESNPLPGRDLSGVLSGGEKADPKRAVFGDYENTRSIRTADWKLIERIDTQGEMSALNSHDELYDLKSDPGETVNLYKDPGHQPTRDELKERLQKFFSEHKLPKHDMWNGGESQTHNIVMGDHAAERYRTMVEKRGYPYNPFDPDYIPPAISIPDGLAVEVAAAPPFVNKPVTACLDEKGRLYVGENRNGAGQVRILEDSNDDGLFDRMSELPAMSEPLENFHWEGGFLFVKISGEWKKVDVENGGVPEAGDAPELLPQREIPNDSLLPVIPRDIISYQSDGEALNFSRMRGTHYFASEQDAPVLHKLTCSIAELAPQIEASGFLSIKGGKGAFVRVIEDADGSLIVVDSGAAEERAGAVYRIRRAGTYDHITDWRGDELLWEGVSPETLCARLDDKRLAVREKSALLLVSRIDDSFESLSTVLESHANANSRCLVLQIFSNTAHKKSFPLIRAALKDPEVKVRIAATHAASKVGDKAALTALRKNLYHASGALRFETIGALSKIGKVEAVPDLVTALCSKAVDPQIEDKLIHTLIGIGDRNAIDTAFTSVERHHDLTEHFSRVKKLVMEGI